MILSPEHQLLRDTLADFAARELAPNAARWAEAHEFPADALRKLGELGLYGITVPTEWGGAGLDTLAAAVALEEIAVGDGATSTIISVTNSVGCGPIERFGDAWQKDTFLRPMASGQWLGAFCLTEAQAGSDASALRTRAVRDGDDYVLNGAKQFITSGKHADIAIVIAVTDPKAGKKGLSAFIVPTATPGYQVARVEDKLDQAASDTCQIVFDQCRIPARQRLGAEGDGYRIALANLESGRIDIAAQSLGMAHAALDGALRYARERESFGQPIIQHQAVGFRLADLATQLEAARQLVWHAASLKDAGQPCLKEASMAKLFASEMAEKVCSARRLWLSQGLSARAYLSRRTCVPDL